jgi:hypothetical protein
LLMLGRREESWRLPIDTLVSFVLLWLYRAERAGRLEREPWTLAVG